MMIDLEKLTVTMKGSDFNEFFLNLRNQFEFRYSILSSAFPTEILLTENNLKRLAVINAESLLLNDEKMTQYFKQEELDELKTSFVAEDQSIRELLEPPDETRETSIFTKFDAKLNLLKMLE